MILASFLTVENVDELQLSLGQIRVRKCGTLAESLSMTCLFRLLLWRSNLPVLCSTSGVSDPHFRL